MIEYEESFTSVDDAMAYYKKQRRAAVEPVYLCLDFPGRGQVQCTLTRKSIMKIYSITPAGKLRFGSLWDAKAGQLDRLVREALEEAQYGRTSHEGAQLPEG